MKPAKSKSIEIRVIGLVGSLRAESATRMAVQYALRGVAEEGADGEILVLAAYNLPPSWAARGRPAT